MKQCWFKMWVRFPWGNPCGLIWIRHKSIPHLRKWVTTSAITYGSFVYWLGYRALIPKKVRSIRPRVTNAICVDIAVNLYCGSPVLRPVKRRPQLHKRIRIGMLVSRLAAYQFSFLIPRKSLVAFSRWTFIILWATGFARRTYAYVVQLTRTRGSYPRRRWFESSHRHHIWFFKKFLL